MIPIDRRTRIMALALPIIGGMVSQNVLNLVDTAMVGELGDPALAGVGLGSFANFMCIAFITGMSAGVQAMAARRLGEGRQSETAVALNGGLLLVLALAIPASIVFFFLAPVIFPLLQDDPEVAVLGTAYLQCRLAAMVAVGMNFAFRGYWNAVNKSKLYLRTLLVMHVTNIALNYVLIFGHFGFPELGVVGAGLGTAISTFVGTGYYFYLGSKYAKAGGFMRELPSRETFRTMMRLAVPAGMQQFFFAASMTVFFVLIGMIGTPELAASTVLLNLILVAILPGIGFGISAASLVGQSLGAGDPEDAKQWGWDVGKIAVIVVSVICLPMLIVPEWVLGPFIQDAETLALAAPALRLIGGTTGLDALGMVLLQALLGAGDTKTVMKVSIGMQWLFQLPLVFLVGPVLGWGLFAVWGVQVLTRGIQAGVFVRTWRRGSWAKIAV